MFVLSSDLVHSILVRTYGVKEELERVWGKE